MGEIFPCHQFVGEEEYSMGNIWDGITKTEIQSQFKESDCYSKPECQAQLYCSGGCPANTTHEFSCKIFRKRIECSTMVKVAQSIRAMKKEEQAIVQ